MKNFLVAILLSTAVAASAQTVANTSNVLHPLTKNGHGRKGISSLDRDPSLMDEGGASARYAGATTSSTLKQPLSAASIVAKVDPDLNPSKISLIGTVDGLRGKLSVVNNGAKTITPMLQLAVCNREGLAIGFEIKNCAPITPGKTSEIQVLATNLGASDLKIVRLVASNGVR